VGGPVLDGNEALYVQECLRTNSISSVGRFVADFERKFAEFCSVRHAISTCNGTCALHLALIALGLKPGDEVIVPTLTYVATANVVRYCGGRPVLVDVDRTTFNIDPAAIEAKVGPRTRGIIAVHLYGHPAEMDQVRRIAQRHQLFVVEDASEAHGAEYRGARVGGLGGCAAFSFYGCVSERRLLCLARHLFAHARATYRRGHRTGVHHTSPYLASLAGAPSGKRVAPRPIVWSAGEGSHARIYSHRRRSFYSCIRRAGRGARSHLLR